MVEMLINGMATDSLPASDRAIHYGDGVFETLAVRNNRIELWEEHMARLRLGCERLGFPVPDPALLAAEAARLIGERKRSVLKIIVSRGAGGRGYRPPAEPKVSRILALHPWPDWPEVYVSQGVEVRICTTRLGRNPRLAGIKHLNRLEQVLARMEWDDPGVAEGLMLDSSGWLAEGTMSNLFLIQKGRLLTPDLSHCGVAGIMRQKVLESARRRGLPCGIVRLRLRDLEAAEALFLTNSLIGIWPVRRVGAREYAVSGRIISELQTDMGNIRSGFSL